MEVRFYQKKWRWPTDSPQFGQTVRTDWQLLSNMAFVDLAVGNARLNNTESLYQAARFPTDCGLQRELFGLDGRSAKRLARRRKEETRSDWLEIRRSAMLAALVLKLRAATGVKELLTSTAPFPIVEVSLSDHFWGAEPTAQGLIGTNMLGRMWMFARQTRPGSVTNWASSLIPVLWPAAA